MDLAPWPLPTPQPALPRAAPLRGRSPASRSATQLKPDVGTPELPAGRVRVRRDEDGTVTEVDEDSVQRVSPLRSLGCCRDGSPGAGRCPGTMMLLGGGCAQGVAVPAGLARPCRDSRARGVSASRPADQPPQLGPGRGSGRAHQPQRVQRHEHAAAALPCPPALHLRGAQPGGHRHRPLARRQCREGEGGDLGRRDLPGEAATNPLGTVAEDAGRGGAGRWHRGTVTVRGQSGPGMLWGHLGPGMLWGRSGL